MSALTALLDDRDAAVRREAAIALGKLGVSSAMPDLMAHLGDPDTFASWSIRHALRDLHAWDTTALTAALTDPKRQEDALRLTDEVWSVAVVDALIAALPKVDDARVRARIVANLAGLYFRYPDWSGNWFGTNPLAGRLPSKTEPWSNEGMTRVLVGLTQGLRDPAPEVRQTAIIGLAQAGTPAQGVLRQRLTEETDQDTLIQLARTLGALRDVASVTALADLLKSDQQPLAVREAALDALGALPGPQALSARLMLVYDKAAPAVLIARALPELGRSKVLPPNDLAGFLQHPEASRPGLGRAGDCLSE